MKKILSAISTLVFLWAILVVVEYVRVYNGGEKMLVSLGEEKTNEYVETKGLGYSVVNYIYDENNLPEEQLVKEFKVFGITFSLEKIVRKD